MTSSISTFLGYRLYANDITKSLQTEAAAPANANAAAYYNANIGKVSSVGDFVNNYKLFSYAMTAYGLTDMVNAKAFMTKVLESNLSDPNSFVNTLTDPRYATFAKAFQFNTGGTLTSSAALQTSVQKSDIEARFAALSTESASQQQTDTAYYEAHIGTITSADQLVSDPTLYHYVLTAYGLNASTPSSLVEQALESNLSDPQSFAVSATASTDPSTALRPVQMSAALAATVQAFSGAQGFDTTAAASSTDTSAQSAAKAATSYYEATVPTLTSLSQFLGDSKLTAYAISAYGLPSTTTTAQLQAAMTSNVTDPNSAAAQLGSGFVALAKAFAGPTGYQAMASDFNFAADGSVSSQRQLQSAPALSAAVAAYSKTQGVDTTAAPASSDSPATANAKAATAYYEATMPTITSLDQFLGDSKLTSYAIAAYGLPSTTTTDQLKAALTSTLSDPKSAAAQLGSAFVSFAAAFNVDTKGLIDQTPNTAAQTRSQIAATNTSYLWNTMETDAGTTYGTGVQLALYFMQKAPSLSDAYQILGDKNLVSVVQTALGLSSSSSSANIDTQASYISSKINFADFKDPTKLDQFIDRFSALYDLKNTTQSDPVLGLFG